MQFYQTSDLYFNQISNTLIDVDYGSTSSKVRTKALKTTRVLQTARQYYDCTDQGGINYMPLENKMRESKFEAYWEKSLLGNEIMTAGYLSKPAFSIFTMALLEDSGWYEPNYDLADELLFGYREKCGFFDKTCHDPYTKYSEFCYTNGIQSCDVFGEYKDFCPEANEYGNGCRFHQATKTCGKSQKCFEVQNVFGS